MTHENGKGYQTLFDGKQLYKLLSVREQKNGVFIFRAELTNKEERGMSDEKRKEARDTSNRQYIKEWYEGHLQIDGYILLGWLHRGVYGLDKNRQLVRDPGMAAYLPITGPKWVYIWDTHGEYVPHSDLRWGNNGYTHIANIHDKPQRMAIKRMLALLSAPKPPYGENIILKNVWMPSVPLWLLDNKKDMRPLYLAGKEPA